MNVIGVQTQSVKGAAWMTFTVKVTESGRLAKVLEIVSGLSSVRSARRRKMRLRSAGRVAAAGIPRVSNRSIS